MSKKKIINDAGVDYSLLVPVFLLVLIGFVAIAFSANIDNPDIFVNVLMTQLIWIFLGLTIAIVTMLFTTEILWKATPWLYGLGLLLMVLPLIFYSNEVVASTGAKNWVTIANKTLFQPSEFMKISYILMLARSTLWFNQNYPRKTLQDDLKLLGVHLVVTLPVLVLLALQKDLGTALVFLAILAGIVLVSEISWRILVPVITLIIVGITTFMLLFLWEPGRDFLFNMGMDTYQINRINAWLNPFNYSTGIAYQQTQGMLAIGSGGLFGTGQLMTSQLTIPVRESDMIFTVIAENFGFFGAAVVLGLYMFLIYRMLRITFLSNNKFYTYISTGFIMMLVFHIFENIGATIGILPLTGIPLPFISQGGSSLISNLIGVGLVLSMSYQRNILEAERFIRSMKRSPKATEEIIED